MRVLYYLDSLGRGGAEMQALDVCRNATRYGIEITLVAGHGGALESDFVDSGAEFIRLNRKLPIDIYLASQLRRIIRERKIQIVHGYQAVEGLHLYLSTRGLRRVKKVLSFQGFIADRRNRLAAKFLIPRMDVNIAVSEGLKKILSDRDKLRTRNNFTVLFNGADPERLRPTANSVRRELGISEHVPLAGMIGNFYRDPRKDQLTVCRALPAVFDQIADAQFLFVGRVEDGAEEKFADCLNFCVEREIVDRVHFLGGRGDVPDVLAALDVFVLSSLHEGLPVAVSEAMLAGVPLILSDIEPLSEMSGEGKYAEMFPVGDPAAMADKLIPLLNDKEMRANLSQKAAEFARLNFSIDAHMRGLKKIYDKLI